MFSDFIFFKFKTKLEFMFVVLEDGPITGGGCFHKEIIYYWLHFNIFLIFSYKPLTFFNIGSP